MSVVIKLVTLENRKPAHGEKGPQRQKRTGVGRHTPVATIRTSRTHREHTDTCADVLPLSTNSTVSNFEGNQRCVL